MNVDILFYGKKQGVYFHLLLDDQIRIGAIDDLLQVKVVLRRHLTCLSVIILKIFIIHFGCVPLAKISNSCMSRGAYAEMCLVVASQAL